MIKSTMRVLPLLDESHRPKVAELIEKYKLEPELRDVYVEGESDAVLFRWFLSRTNAKHVKVCDVNTVDLPMYILEKHNQDDGRRGRVIALAHEIETGLGTGSHQATCIADSDFNFVFGIHNNSRVLLFTDYTSLEIYLFKDLHLQKFLDLTIHKYPTQALSILRSLTPALRQMFAVRIACHILRWGVELVDFTESCVITATGIDTQLDKYKEKIINKARRWNERAEFDTIVAKYLTMDLGDDRLQIHGHDYMKMLGWYLVKLGVRHDVEDLCRSKAIESIMFLGLEPDDLSAEVLFRTLLSRVAVLD